MKVCEICGKTEIETIVYDSKKLNKILCNKHYLQMKRHNKIYKWEKQYKPENNIIPRYMGDIMAKENKKSKQRILAGIALIVVVLLIASTIFVYYEYYKEDDEAVEDEPIKVIDDRISPLENQGLILDFC